MCEFKLNPTLITMINMITCIANLLVFIVNFRGREYSKTYLVSYICVLVGW